MRKMLACLLAFGCAVPAGAQVALDAAQILTKTDSSVVYDGAKLASGATPVFVPASAPQGSMLAKRPLDPRAMTPNLHLGDADRMKARDKGVWLGLGAAITMEAAWNIRYHAKHPWGMGPESPAYLASWFSVIAFPLIGEQIGKAIDRRRHQRRLMNMEDCE